MIERDSRLKNHILTISRIPNMDQAKKGKYKAPQLLSFKICFDKNSTHVNGKNERNNYNKKKSHARIIFTSYNR